MPPRTWSDSCPVCRLGDKRGPILWQLLPNRRAASEWLERFAVLLPGELTYDVGFRKPRWLPIHLALPPMIERLDEL